MYPAPFSYVRVASVAEALAALAEYPDGRFLAGGHSLLPALKLRLAEPATLIDIGRLAELQGIAQQGGTLTIGSLATHDQVARSDAVCGAARLLAEACGKVGDPAVRNWGTLGGNLAHADPASDPPAALVAAGARLELQSSSGQRWVAADEFFSDLFLTALASDEIITAVELPGAAGAGTGSAYLKHPHPASGYAVCGAAAVVSLNAAGRCSRARLAIGGVGPVPVAIDLAALSGETLEQAAVDAALAGIDIADPLSDPYASGDYRIRLARVLGRRALLLAASRAAA
jgi:carbon-monoxide dehydrogenase medium subunit